MLTETRDQLNISSTEQKNPEQAESTERTDIEKFLNYIESLKGEKIEKITWAEAGESIHSTLRLETKNGKTLIITLTDWYNVGQVDLGFEGINEEGRRVGGRLTSIYHEIEE